MNTTVAKLEFKTVACKAMHGGHRVESVAEITHRVPGKTLKVLTMKRSGGRIVTGVTVVTHEGKFETFRAFTDFSQTIRSGDGRATVGVVERQHKECMTDERIAVLMDQIVAHYVKLGEATA